MLFICVVSILKSFASMLWRIDSFVSRPLHIKCEGFAVHKYYFCPQWPTPLWPHYFVTKIWCIAYCEMLRAQCHSLCEGVNWSYSYLSSWIAIFVVNLLMGPPLYGIHCLLLGYIEIFVARTVLKWRSYVIIE